MPNVKSKHFEDKEFIKLVKNKKMIKVLVAEDEQKLRRVLKDKLTEEGFTVFTAVDGEETLEIAYKEHPDLILLDLYMPNVSGFDVIEKLMQDDWGKTVDILVLSNRGDYTSKHKVYNMKEITYLIKAENSLDDVVYKILKTLKVRLESEDIEEENTNKSTKKNRYLNYFKNLRK